MIRDDPFFRSVFDDMHRQMSFFFDDTHLYPSNRWNNHKNQQQERAFVHPIAGLIDSFFNFGSPMHPFMSGRESNFDTHNFNHRQSPRNLMFKQQDYDRTNEPIIEFPDDDEQTPIADNNGRNDVVPVDNQRNQNVMSHGLFTGGLGGQSPSGYFKSYSYSYSYTGGPNGRVKEKSVYRDSTGREEVNERDEELPYSGKQPSYNNHRALQDGPLIQELTSSENYNRNNNYGARYSKNNSSTSTTKDDKKGGLLSKITSFFKF